jgi:hypothetical protein
MTVLSLVENTGGLEVLDHSIRSSLHSMHVRVFVYDPVYPTLPVV